MPPSNFPIVCCLLEVKNLQAQILLLAALDARRLDSIEQVAQTLLKHHKLDIFWIIGVSTWSNL